MLWLLLSRALKPNSMKIDRNNLIHLSGKMERVVVVNGGRAWAHSVNELRDYFRMYLSGYSLREVGEYYDLTYHSVHAALTNNLVNKLSYYKPMHRENRKRLKAGEKPLTVVQFESRVTEYHGYWDESGKWVEPVH